MFGDGGYHSKYSESSNDLIGFAKLAGIVTAALVTRKHWAPVIGKYAAQMAARKAPKATMQGVGVDDAIEGLLSEEVGTAITYVEQLRRNISTFISRTKRTDEISKGLRLHMDTGKSTIDTEAIRPTLQRLLDVAAKAGQVTDTEFQKFVGNPKSIDTFLQESKAAGIVFNQRFLRDPSKVLKQLVDDAGKISASRKEIEEFMEANADTLERGFEKALEKVRKKGIALRKLIDPSISVEREISVDDLIRDKTIAQKVHNFLDVQGIDTGAESHTEAITSRLGRALRNVRKQKLVDGVPQLREPMLKLDFRKLQTGLALTKEGQVISLAQQQRGVENLINKVVDEGQLPLVPYFFSVPFKAFKFLSPSREPVKNLGLLLNEPEIARAFKTFAGRELSPFEYGMNVGDTLLSINPKTNTAELFEDTRIISFKQRESHHIRAQADVRRLEVDNYGDTLRNFRGAEDDTSTANKFLHSNQKLFSDLDYDPDLGIIVKAKADLLSPLVQKVHGNTGRVNLQDVNPVDLSKFVETNWQNMRPEHQIDAMRYILTEARTNQQDISPLLQRLMGKIDSGEIDASFRLTAPSYHNTLLRLLHSTDSPESMLRILNQPTDATGVLDVGKTMFELAPDLYREASPILTRAIHTIHQDKEGFLRATRGKTDLAGTVKEALQGQSGLPESQEKLQEGLLDELLRGKSIANLDNELENVAIRRGKTSAVATFEQLADELESWEVSSLSKTNLLEMLQVPGLRKRFAKLGLLSPEGEIDPTHLDDLREFIGEIVVDTKSAIDPDINIKRVNVEALKRFAAITDDHSAIFEMADVGTKGKIAGILQESFEAFGTLRRGSEKVQEAYANLLDEMYHGADVAEALLDKFRFGRAAHPEPPRLDPLAINQYYSVLANGFSWEDMLSSDNAWGYFAEHASKGFGVGKFAHSMVDPSVDVGAPAMAATLLLQMPQHIGNLVGLGLPGQDRITALRSGGAFFLKRVLPLMVGYEAYKNFNSNAHEADLPGLDDIGANLVANVNLMGAGLKDVLGLTELNKFLVNSLPGLDMYFSPRSQDEYLDHMYYGEEDVREGRGWFIGTRGHLMGGRVKHVRPSFYRRWKSHWTEAENVDIANAEYSWLPSLAHPLAPLKRLISPTWWEDKHKEDRPYIPGGENVFPIGTEEESFYYTTGGGTGDGATSIGSFGGGYPAKLTGGGGSFGGGGGAGSAGIGGVGIGEEAEEGPERFILRYHQGIPTSALENDSIFGEVKDWIRGARTQMGLYGAIMQRIPFYPAAGDGYPIQKSEQATSFGRMMWMGEYGEATGPIGEFFRRFIQPEPVSFDAYSPYPNNMPTWLPSKFRCITGDTLVETNGKELVRADKLRAGDTIRSHKGNLLPVTQIVKRVMDVGEKLYKISVGGKLPFTFKISEEHPVWTPSGWREIQHIHIGDWVGYPIPEISTLVESETVIDLSKHLETDFIVTDSYIYPRGGNPDLYVLMEYMEANNILYWKRGQCREVCKMLGLSWNKFLGSKARRSLLSTIHRIPRYLDLDSKDWGIFIGYFIAEGSASEKNISFAFHEEERASYGRELEAAVQNLWGLKGSWYQYKSSGKGIQFIFVNKILSQILRKYIGTSCSNKKLKVGLNSWKDTLRCLINGDGCFCNSKNLRYRMGFKQPHNKEICYHIWQLLLSQSIVGSLGYDGLDYKGRQAQLAANCMGLDKNFDSGYKYTRSVSSNGHWYIENGYIYFKLRSKEIVPQEELLAITIDGDSSFCLPGLATHNTGDPYMRTPGIGELQLPGEAFLKAHPWVLPMKARGSMIGLSPEEMVYKWLNPDEQISGDMEDVVGYGSEAHKLVQRQLNDQGVLVGAEVSIYDEANNISGTIDAIVRGETGLEVVEIKTQGDNNWGQTPDKYIDQLNFYLATTGIKRGHIAFVNRNNPSQVRMETFEFDSERWKNTLDTLGEARHMMEGMIKRGEVSPYEAYDIVGRIEVLSYVAPSSPEFKQLIAKAQDGGLGGFEKQRVDQAIERANRLTKRYNTYPLRDVGTDTRLGLVQAIGDDGSVVTDIGTFSFAGMKWDAQAFANQEATDILAEMGIEVGVEVPITLIEGGFNLDVLADTTTPAIFGNVNKRLIKEGYGDPVEESNHPLDVRVLQGHNILTNIWEPLAHTDNLITNKLLRVRTALEQFERGEVFGSDQTRWDDLYGNYIEPTIASVRSKNVIAAGLQGSVIAGMFVRTAKSRMKAAGIGGLVGAGLSALTSAQEFIQGEPWTPRRYRKQAEFDEYWDALEFIKQTALAEDAKLRAKVQEGVDINALTEEQKRASIGLGPWGTMAVAAEQKAKRTMFAFDAATSTFQDAIMALPQRQQQIAEEIITMGTPQEKERFYELLPDSQKRVLGKFLGIRPSSLPDRPNLTKMFQERYLPDQRWEGWRWNVDLEDLETRAAAVENMKIDKPSRMRAEKSRSTSQDVEIPRMDAGTPGNIAARIRNIVQSGVYGNLQVDFVMRPTDSSLVNVNLNLQEDQTSLMSKYVKEEFRNL